MRTLLVSFLLLCLLCPGALADPAAVTMFYQTNRPMNANTERTRAAVLQATGIDMQLVQGGGNWKQQLSMYLRRGEMPDLVGFLDEQTFLEIASEGAFYDLTGKLDRYPNILHYLSGVSGYTADELLLRASIDGHLYGIPSVTVARSYYTVNIRTDWLAAVGEAVPVTLEDWVRVLQAFTREDPDGNGADDTYGFSGSRQYLSLTPLFGAFGSRPDQAYYLENGKIVTNVISDRYRQALSFLRDLYRQHVIDPDMFIATDAQINEKWVDGRFGLWCSWWSGAGNSVARYGYTKQNPENSIAVIQPPVGAEGMSGVIAQDPCESFFAIGYNCQDPDAVLRLIDYACTTDGHRTLMWGPEGQFWIQDEQGNIDWYSGIDNRDAAGNEVGDMQVYRFFYNIPVENSVLGLNTSMAGKLYQASAASYEQIPVIQDLFLGLWTEESARYDSLLDDYVERSGIRFITGEDNIDTDWDRYVAAFLQMGGDAVRQSLLREYNGRNGTEYEFAD